MIQTAVKCCAASQPRMPGRRHYGRTVGRPQRQFEPPREEQLSLEDTDVMPFGKHVGVPMAHVPAAYFHYLWVNGMRNDQRSPVAAYIRRSLAALRKEHADGIWD